MIDKDAKGLMIELVRKNDTDVSVVNFTTSTVEVERGHWMAGSTHTTTALVDQPQPELRKIAMLSLRAPVPSGAEVLRSWFDEQPAAWLRSGRAVLVRPTDALRDVPVHLCESARDALSSGRTLLLLRGALARIPLAGDRHGVTEMYVAGLILRDGAPCDEPVAVQPKTAEEAESDVAADAKAAIDDWCTWSRRLAPSLVLEAVIIAERLARVLSVYRGHGYDGRVLPRADADRATVREEDAEAAESYNLRNEGRDAFTPEGMFDWRPHDVYYYHEGRVRNW